MSEVRSLQLTGGATYIISLPKNWVDQNGLKPHDKLVILEQDDGSLVIYPMKIFNRKANKDIELNAGDLKNLGSLTRECIGYYLAGFDSLKITLKNNEISKDDFKNQIREKLIGVEVIEEGIYSLSLQVFAENKETNIIRTLNRLYSLVFLMLENMLEGIKRDENTLKSVIKLDNEVDRFYHFITRQINLAIVDPYLMIDMGVSKKQVLIEYRLASKTLERIADHIEAISKYYLEEKGISEEFKGVIIEIGKKIVKEFSKSFKALINADSKLAHDTIFELEETKEMIKRFRKEKESESNIMNRMMLESFKRITEYSIDICELAINLSKLSLK